MRITEYRILYGENADELVKNINAAIKQGWQPIGNVTVNIIDKEKNEIVLVQAIVKYEHS